MKIRQAEISDAVGIGRVHVDSWRTTYKGIIPDDFLNSLSYEQRTKLWERNIAKEDNYVVVAENNEGEIIAFGDAWKRESNKLENSGDLTSIYLLEEYQGKGIGKMLFKALFEHFKQLGYEKCLLMSLKKIKPVIFMSIMELN